MSRRWQKRTNYLSHTHTDTHTHSLSLSLFLSLAQRLWVVFGSSKLLTTRRSRSTGVANPTPGRTNLRVKSQTSRESGFARAF